MSKQLCMAMDVAKQRQHHSSSCDLHGPSLLQLGQLRLHLKQYLFDGLIECAGIDADMSQQLCMAVCTLQQRHHQSSICSLHDLLIHRSATSLKLQAQA